MASITEIKNNSQFKDVSKEPTPTVRELTKQEWQAIYDKTEDWLKIPNFVPHPDEVFTEVTGLRAPEEIRTYRTLDGQFKPYSWCECVAMDLHDEMEERDDYDHDGDDICPYCTWSTEI